MIVPATPTPFDSAVPVLMPDILTVADDPQALGGLGFEWSWVQQSIDSASKVLLPAVATRIQTQPGVSITTTPQGQVISQQAAGYPIVAGNLGANVASSGGFGTFLVAAMAVGAILLLRR